ncbi:unnamed protein product, partial [marine sediment metagenome]
MTLKPKYRNIWFRRGFPSTCTTPTFTVAPAFGGPILADVNYKIITHVSLSVDVAAIEAKLDARVFAMDFWSDPDDEFLLNAVVDDKALPDVVVAGIPALATVIRATAIFKCRVIEDTSGFPNGINGTQYIQVKEAAGAYI